MAESRSVAETPRPPTKEIERNTESNVEPNVLPLEAEALHRCRRTPVPAGTDSTFRVDHAMPGNAAAIVERIQRVSDEARLAGHACEPCDLSVRRDPATRDARDHRIDPAITGGRSQRAGISRPMGCSRKRSSK